MKVTLNLPFKKTVIGLLIFLIPAFPIKLAARDINSWSNSAEWTILVFMNGDNNLNDAAMEDFMEMSKIGSSNKINIVVQLDRIGEDTTGPYWSQTLRFLVKKEMIPSPETAIEDLGETNMGDGKVLSDFVSWGMSKYPAKHFMLIIWDHGQGWRLTTAFDGSSQSSLSERSSSEGPYKSVSYDETDKDELYNREIQDNLTATLKDKKLDILGFDACLMAMVETGYAFRNIAGILVASEELEPGTGWQYDDWLKKLNGNASADPKTLSQVLVDSYKKRYTQQTRIYKPDPTTTLSALQLSQIGDVAAEIDKLSGILVEKLNGELPGIKTTRDKCEIYAPRDTDKFYHIDIAHFLNTLSKTIKDEQIVNQAKIAHQAVLKAVIGNYRGHERAGNFGSFGLAIYFPPNEKSYKEDGYATNGYEKDNTVYPVEFVQNYRWADFLHAYFKVVP